jgi:RNA polymerase sigma factor (sigma-70 family)
VESGPTGAMPRYFSALFEVGTLTGLSDRALLERFATRSGAHDAAAELAFAALVERHGPMVLRVCIAVLGNRHEAEDAFQATFLVLASRARSIRRADSVGSWLHGVALRVAARARSRTARRRRHERRRAEMIIRTSDAGGDHDIPTADDRDRVLHEEIGRLPEKYRKPVVLCYLEGLTHDRAADQLGWPVGTVRRRLAWARDRLRGRLTRRGVAPSVLPIGLLGSGLAREATWATTLVPASLTDATVRGALRVGLGKAALVGIVSAEAIALMKGVLQTMTTTKLTLLTATVLTACLVTTGVGLLAYPGQRPGIRAAPAQAGAGHEPGAVQEKGGPPRIQEPAGPSEAGGRMPDDQLNALLREYDEIFESSRKAVGGGVIAAEKKAQVQSNLGKLRGVNGRMLELATHHPRTNAAEQALIWLVANNAFEPETKTAWEILARDHAQSDRLKQVFSRRLVQLHWASRAVEDLLRNALEQNPYREIRGLACYWLAAFLEYRAEILRLWSLEPPRQAEFWRQRFSQQDLDGVAKQDPKGLEDEAARLYERVITEFPFVANNDTRTERPPLVLGRLAVLLPSVAKVNLDGLRRLAVGNPAPEIQGVDLVGKPMKLSDFRGKVVVLSLNATGGIALPPPRIPAFVLQRYRGLARTFAGKPVAFLGAIASDREEFKKGSEASGLPIRFWWDPDEEGKPDPVMVWGPRPGPIRTAWGTESPGWYVIDSQGIIRYSRVPGPEMLEKAVATLLKEQAGQPEQPRKPD